MLFDAPMNLTAAIKILAAKDLLPTALDSAGLRQLDAGLRRQSLFSARTTNEYLLQLYKEKLTGLLRPQPAPGETTTQFSSADVRASIKEFLSAIGYQPETGQRGTLQDLASDARINLVVDTNRELAQGAGWFIQGNDPAALDAFPAQELTRVVNTKVHRNWSDRWQIAARAAGDTDALRVLGTTGRMMARKDSPVWEQLGSSDNFDDALDNPFPPFAFNSGMDVRDIGYREALDLALVKPGEPVRPQLPDDLSHLFFTA